MKKCNHCGRVDGEIHPDFCGSPITCAGIEGASEVVPGKDAVVKCSNCDIIRAFPTQKITQGKSLTNLGMVCPVTDCMAMISTPSTKKPQAAPSTVVKAPTDGEQT